MINRSIAVFAASLLFAGLSYAQEAQPPQGNGQQQTEQQREGAPRWQYQSEQSEARTYTQPSYAPSIPLEVEQLRNRVAALEDRAEKLEKTLSDAVQVINAQTESIQKLSGQ